MSFHMQNVGYYVIMWYASLGFMCNNKKKDFFTKLCLILCVSVLAFLLHDFVEFPRVLTL